MWSGQPESPSPPQRPVSSTGVVVIVVMWIAWLGVTLVADFLGFMMFAFADSPDSARAAQAMIVPAFVWFGFTFVAGAVLLFLRRWWQIVLAFVLAVSPPFVIFAGYNLLAGAGGSGSVSSGSVSGGGAGTSVGGAGVVDPDTGRLTPTAPVIPVPPGGFKPPPMKAREQPDFRKYLPTTATTRPTTAAATQP